MNGARRTREAERKPEKRRKKIAKQMMTISSEVYLRSRTTIKSPLFTRHTFFVRNIAESIRHVRSVRARALAHLCMCLLATYMLCTATCYKWQGCSYSTHTHTHSHAKHSQLDDCIDETCVCCEQQMPGKYNTDEWTEMTGMRHETEENTHQRHWSE